MAAPTRAQLKQRIRDYLKTYVGIGDDCTDADTPTRFPAFDVQIDGTTRRRSAKRNVPTYNVSVYIYGCLARDVTKDKVSRADRAVTEVFIDPIADFIADNPTLKLDGEIPVVMFSMNSELLVNDAGVGLLDLNDKQYAGFALEFTITSGR